MDEIIELFRQRQDLHRSEKGLTLRIRAKCRRLCDSDKKEADILYDAIFGKKEHELAPMALALAAPFIESRTVLENQRKETEKQLEKLAKQLPVAEWIANTRGIGYGSLAAIVGCAGPLDAYDNPAKLWKRMGLAVIGGERQRRVKDKEMALEHGYSPSRRSVMWTIGDSMFRAGGYYADLCRERKAYEAQKAEAKGLIVCPAVKIKKGHEDEYMSHGHIHNRAKRYMEKRLLRDLWRAWRDSA